MTRKIQKAKNIFKWKDTILGILLYLARFCLYRTRLVER